MAVAGLFLLSFISLAGQERYDYDPLGRLVRVIDERGRVRVKDSDLRHSGPFQIGSKETKGPCSK